MVEAARNPHSNRIGQKRENERRGPDDFADSAHGRATIDNEYAYLELDELPCEDGKPGGDAIRIAIVDDQVLPFDVSEFTQPESECLDVSWFARCASQVADAPDFAYLLGIRGERSANKDDCKRANERPPIRH
jgi:hypothetical protein